MQTEKLPIDQYEKRYGPLPAWFGIPGCLIVRRVDMLTNEALLSIELPENSGAEHGGGTVSHHHAWHALKPTVLFKSSKGLMPGLKTLPLNEYEQLIRERVHEPASSECEQQKAPDR